ncbi:hypothetical protein ACIGHG_23445 [Bacillus sp. NPDC077411]|uniref:hypothetical protein n=1 Tax=Bacillus sp. NPDC077411 TaxID=3363947 RepID=UPI0037C9FEB7
MKKFLFIISFLFFCLTFSLINSIQLQNEINKLLYDNKTSLYIDYKQDIDYTEFINSLYSFSSNHKVSIEQYTYLDDRSVNIYRSNFNTFDKNLLKNGRLPKMDSKEFISNQKLYMSDKDRIGTLNIPDSILNISLYSFNSIENSGISNIMYISSNTKDFEEETIKFLSNYGKVRVMDKLDSTFSLTDTKQLIAVGIAFVLLLLSIVYYLELHVKKIGIMKLLGWNEKSIVSYFAKKILLSISCTSFISFFLILVYQYGKGALFHVLQFFTTSLVLTIIILLLIFLLIISLFYIRLFNMQLNNILKGKENTRNLNIVNNTSKIVITILVFFFVGKSLTNIKTLNVELEQLKFWKNTKNIYSLSLTNLPSDDLQLDRKINDHFLELYHKLTIEKQAFMINAENFTVVDFKGEPKYFYQTNIKNEQDLFGIYGKSVVIDTNYLKVNPIYGVLSENPLDNIEKDSNTLNVLVPEKLKDKEAIIKEELVKGFYFQKVKVKDIYNKDANQELEKISKDDLKVNIIYVKNNQKYFTYSVRFGSPTENYKITDPIAILFNDSIDTSFIKAYATKSIYFKDSSNKPYKNIEPLLNESKTKGHVAFVTSVFSTANTKIVYLENEVKTTLTILLTLALLSFTLLSNTAFLFHKINKQKIQVMYLLGKGFYEINKPVLLFNNLILIFNIIVFYIIYKDILIVFFGSILIISEWIILKIMDNYLLKKNISHLLKEGR